MKGACILVVVFAAHAVATARPDEPSPAAYLGVLLDPDRDRPIVVSVVEGSPAAKAGVRSGDIITKVDGKAVGARDEVQAAIRKKKPGDEVVLALARGKDTVEVK